MKKTQTMILMGALLLTGIAGYGGSSLHIGVHEGMKGNADTVRVKKVNENTAYTAEELMSEVKAQITDEQSGMRDIRFVVAVKGSYDEENGQGYVPGNYGFKVAINGTEKEVKATKYYNSVYAGEEGYANAISSATGLKSVDEFAGKEGYFYFIALTVENVPSASYDTDISVTPFVEIDGSSLYGTTKTASVGQFLKTEAVLPVLTEKTKVDGAGVMIYFDNSVLSLTSAEEVSSIDLTVSGKVSGSEEPDATLSVTGSQIDSIVASEARLYIILNKGFSAGDNYTHLIDARLTIGNTIYTSELEFVGNVLTKLNGKATRTGAPKDLIASFDATAKAMNVAWTNPDTYDSIQVELVKDGTTLFTTNAAGSSLTIAETDLSTGTFETGNYIVRIAAINGDLISDVVSASVVVGELASASLPIVTDDSKTKIIGAGAAIYFDNNELGLTGSNVTDATLDVTFEGVADEGSSFSAYATGGAAAIQVTNAQIDSITDAEARIYLTLNAGLPDANLYTHRFTIRLTIGTTEYTSTVEFYNNALKSVDGLPTKAEAPTDLTASFDATAKAMNVAWTNPDTYDSIRVELVKDGTTLFATNVTESSLTIAETDLSTGVFETGNYTIKATAVSGELTSETMSVSVVVGQLEESALNFVLDSTKTKIAGAGVFVYFDNSETGITGANASDVIVDITLTGSCDADSSFQTWVSGGSDELKLSGSYNFQDYSLDGSSACLYFTMDKGLPDDSKFTHTFDIRFTIGSKIYSGQIQFYNNSLISE